MKPLLEFLIKQHTKKDQLDLSTIGIGEDNSILYREVNIINDWKQKLTKDLINIYLNFLQPIFDNINKPAFDEINLLFFKSENGDKLPFIMFKPKNPNGNYSNLVLIVRDNKGIWKMWNPIDTITNETFDFNKYKDILSE